MMYNGFDAGVQKKSTDWMFRQIKNKVIREYPDSCDCCGQVKGKIGYHAESYAVPFGPHIVAFNVCHLCHVMIHSAARNAKRVREYAEKLANGYQFRNFKTFNWKGAKDKYLNAIELPLPIDPKLLPAPTHDHQLFTKIIDGCYDPRNGHDEFWAPDDKLALFHTQEGLDL